MFVLKLKITNTNFETLAYSLEMALQNDISLFFFHLGKSNLYHSDSQLLNKKYAINEFCK